MVSPNTQIKVIARKAARKQKRHPQNGKAKPLDKKSQGKRPSENGKIKPKTSPRPKSTTRAEISGNKNSSHTNGPVFSSNVSARMAALQAFVNDEAKASVSNEDNGSKIKSKKLSSPKNVKAANKANTPDEDEKLKELKEGIDKDDREINYLQRQLQYNSRQKKNNNLFRNMFGGDIGDLFEMLENEPTEADLLAEKPLEADKSTNKPKVKPKVELPKNTIFVDTSTISSDGAHETSNPSNSSGDSRNKKRKLSDSQDSDDCETGTKKFKGKSTSLVAESSTLLNGKSTRKQKKNSAKDSDSSPVKSIINTKKKKFRKQNRRLSVSFDLGKNDVRLIPPIIKQSGFIVVNDNTPLFCNEQDNCSSNGIDDDDAMVDSEDGSIEDESDFEEDDFEYGSESESEEESDWEEDDDIYSGSDEICDDFRNNALYTDYSSEYDSDDIHMEATFTDSENSNEEDSSDNESVEEGTELQSKKPSSLSEDIYGRLRDNEGNVIESSSSEAAVSTYCSPAQRRNDKVLQEQLKEDSMKRVCTQLRGRLNRLAGVNLAGTVTMVCSLYENHPRQLLNIIISDLLMSELASETLTLDRHCQECAVLVAALSANVAEEIGAHILTDFVVSWHEELQKGEDACGPQLRNYIMFVSHLFSFGLVHSALLYDILRQLTSNFNSNTVDQMILMMGCVGFLLRKDDPAALKEFVIKVQGESSSSVPQLQLLNAMLRAIKNNNESKMPDYDPSHTEHLRKLLKSFVGGELKITPLRVTLDDLLHSETRGRWWVVGSAWSGGSLVQPKQPSSLSEKGKCNTAAPKTQFSESFMKLAESMRITRPPRINILFTLTVGSDNVDEAIVKLTELSLPPSQEKNIFDVMIYCVQKMRAYKPFYALLSNRLCHNEPKYKRLLQHSLWDKFSDFDALKHKDLKNLAKFVVQIIKEDSLNLSVLKTLPFSETNQKIVDFLEDMFCQLFTHEEGDHVSYDAFQKLFLSKKLQPLRMQFKMFIQVFIVPKCEEGEMDKRCHMRVVKVLDLLGSDMGALL